MKVFISWSGARSRVVALALRKWIPDVLQNVRPWVSEADIDAGMRWSRAIEEELSETSFGILCLTEANQSASWLLFEAGALAKTIADTFVCPYLIDLNPADLAAGPLAQFQAKRATEKDTWELICAINRALASNSLSEESLRRAFDRWWPDLRQTLNDLPPEGDVNSAIRSADDKVDEILDLVRGLSRERTSEKVSLGRQDEAALSSSALKDLSAALHAQAGSLEHMLDRSRPYKIQVDLGIATENGRIVSIEVMPRESLFGTLSTIWGEMQGAEGAPEAYTYLWDWILIRKVDQLPLLAGGAVTRMILAHEIFREGDEWSVHHLTKPLIEKSGRFGLVRGEPYGW